MVKLELQAEVDLYLSQLSKINKLLLVARNNLSKLLCPYKKDDIIFIGVKKLVVLQVEWRVNELWVLRCSQIKANGDMYSKNTRVVYNYEISNGNKL